MKKRMQTSLAVFAVIGMILLSGCAFGPVVDTTQFYVLDVEKYRPISEAGTGDAVVLGMARVQVARYLDSPGIAVREQHNRIVYSQNHRWAESLEYGIARMLVETLRQEPAVGAVAAYPVKRRPQPDYDLHVSIVRAEGVVEESSSRAAFQAIWELRTDDDQVIASGEVDEDGLPWDGESIERLAAILSDATATLSQQIAQNIEKL